MRELPLTDPGVPDQRSPRALLWWLVRGQRRTLAGGAAFGVAWMAAQALVPAAIGRALDRGIRTGDTGSLLAWAAALVGLAAATAASGVMRHRFAVTNFSSPRPESYNCWYGTLPTPAPRSTPS